VILGFILLNGSYFFLLIYHYENILSFFWVPFCSSALITIGISNLIVCLSEYKIAEKLKGIVFSIIFILMPIIANILIFFQIYETRMKDMILNLALVYIFLYVYNLIRKKTNRG
jgi:hypothetical protein